MVELLAKKYVKALVDGKECSLVEKYAKDLNEIASAYTDDKFMTIISSSDVATEDKVNLIVSFVEAIDQSVKNLISLLGKNRRLEIIPAITDELNRYLGDFTKNYTGVVYSSEALGDDYINSLAEKFASKFDVSLTLKNVVCDYDGVKVDIEGLGIEIGLSKDRLRTQLIEHILKAV